ncbi:efflux RND transporter periplasmic adaptor subunit [Paraburkholderia kururiensis]|uniref:Efflux RND transporter periplasmic adaptor subunit n=1 Tax=Paraburkholderia kururiensis TaxID=984307 RepID=A0ABZ0WTX3_9BURK|nr:efflux RND transporter periplasmic adaptor subunit [Paraburkholderia kururiensis]WQD80844.1 efflux RND transporter periplasmic adaptor subunit [Paraburkholderia kururiensis]
MRGNRIAKGVATMAMLTFLAACKEPGSAANREAAHERPVAQVSVVTLRAQTVPLTTELSGRVVASLEAEVRPQVTGIIQKRLFREGGEVKVGEALYQIDPATYQAAYDSARAALVKAEAAVPGALAKADRYSDLVRRNAISKQEYEDAVDVLAQARANVAVAKAAVETARISLDYTTIRAPISGRIDRSSLTPGALVTTGQATALTTIRQIDPINVDLTQSSASLLALRQAIESGRLQSAGAGMGVKLRLENGTVYPHAGKLEFAESSVNQTTGTYILRAVLRNPSRLLLPGMYVRAVVDEGTVPHAFLIPQRAVSRGLRGEATALFVRNGKVVEQALAGARQIGNDWLVQTGVADGDQVIVEGSQLVREGDTVTAVHVELDKTTGAVRPTRAVARADGADSPDTLRPALIRDRQASRG